MNGIIGRYEITANLWDEDYTGISGTLTYKAIYVGDGTFTLSSNIPNVNYSVIFFLAGRPQSGASTGTNDVYEGLTRTVTAVNGYVTIAFRKSSNTNTPENYDTMLNKGETALPYEPYGNTWNDIPYSRLETATDVVTTLPVTVYGDGETDISLLLKGNTETSGTPSPQNPITIEGVGEKTVNLFNKSTITPDKGVDDATGDLYSATTSAASDYIDVSGLTKVTISNTSASRYGAFYDDTKTYISGFATFGTKNVPATAKYMRVTVRNESIDTFMVVQGETLPTDYIPYGYEITISSNQTALTPVYLTEQLMKIGDYADSLASGGTVTYNIKKLVLTGQESFWADDGTVDTRSRYRILPTGADTVLRGNRDDLYCTHFKTDLQVSANSVLIYNGTTGVFIYFYVPTADYPTLADFKTYIQQQYAAGTPVTLYYILATPTTETVTAPTIPTTGGEVSIDVDTTVKPSEINLTYHGWHEHQPLKRENGAWV